MRSSLVAFGVVLVGASARFAAQYASLPPMVASHFGGNGLPNAWMPRSTFAMFGLLPVGTALLVAFLGPFLLARSPVSRVNLPNKEYWLAPERRAETVQRFATRMEWFAVALLLLFAVVYELVFEANAGDGRLANGPFVVALVSFLVFVVAWLVSLYRAFALPKS